MTLKDVIQWGVIIGASLVAALTDIRSRRIPNLLTGPVFIAGLIWSVYHNGLSGFGQSFGAAAVMAFPFIILFLFAGGGAGDAKLAAAVGTWLNIQEAFIALACICICGAILGLIAAIQKKYLKNLYANLITPVFDWMLAFLGRGGVIQAINSTRQIQGEKLTVPYGVAIFAGMFFAAIIILSGVQLI